MYFLNHQNLEDSFEGTPSKFNRVEAEMIIKFTNYLLQQGY